MSRRFVPLATVFTLLLIAGRPGAATTVVALGDADLARGARTILHGDVVSKESFVAAEGGRIYTEYRFAVRELLKGEAARDGTVTFREWGGVVDGVGYWIPGVSGYSAGEEVVAFLGEEDPRTGVGFTFGLAQGKFRVERDATRALVRRSLDGLQVVPRPGAPEPAGGGDTRDLEAFKTAIRAEVRQ